MPSANKTPNYGLNQWQGNEYPKRQDFVDDNAAVDAAIKARENEIAAHTADAVAHMTQGQKDTLNAAVQSATIGGSAVTKSGTTLQLPAYPTQLPANGGTATYANYPTHAIAAADFGLRGNYISSAAPSGGSDGDTWDQI